MKSNVADAQAAVSRFKKHDVPLREASVHTSNIAGMADAVNIANVLLEYAPLFEVTINEQAAVIPALAAAIEERERQAAKDFAEIGNGGRKLMY